MQRFWLSKWLWLLAYLVMLFAIGTLVVQERNRLLSADRDQQKQDWQAWRSAAAKQDGRSGPVQRIVPKSAEPPMVVMMRDKFPIIFGAAMFFPALILGFFLVVARGVLRQALDRKAREAP